MGNAHLPLPAISCAAATVSCHATIGSRTQADQSPRTIIPFQVGTAHGVSLESLLKNPELNPLVRGPLWANW